MSALTQSKEKRMKSLQKKLEGISSFLADERRRLGTFAVLGEGNLDTQIVCIGEAPGKKESETSKPFCGASGKLLNELLASIGLKREDIYTTNIVKDRPPKNRDPKPQEVEEYAKLLDTQLDIIAPEIVVTLGRISFAYIRDRYKVKVDPKLTIGEVHGKAIQTKDFILVPLYHPATALYSRNMLPTLLEDMLTLKKMIS